MCTRTEVRRRSYFFPIILNLCNLNLRSSQAGAKLTLSKSFLKSRKDCHISAQISMQFLQCFFQTLTILFASASSAFVLIYGTVNYILIPCWTLMLLERKSCVTSLTAKSCVHLHDSFRLSSLHSSLKFLSAQGSTSPTDRRKTTRMLYLPLCKPLKCQ